MSKITIRKVQERVEKLISGDANRGGIYARGLAGEGYKGGYRDAIEDVLLFYRGVRPRRHGWWASTPDPKEE